MPRSVAPKNINNGDFVIPLLLLPAMRRGENLDIPITISHQLSAALPTVQDIFTIWDRAKTRIVVSAAATVPSAGMVGRGVACFCSGGVDSYYTLLKHRDEITHLIFVHGFDMPLTAQWRRERSSALVRRAAATLGKSLVEIETDIRHFSDPFVGWNDYHGAALAVVALLLGNAFRKVYIPATFTYADLIPLGSHPLLDPLWSTESVEIVHDGCEASRVDKLRLLATEPLLIETLRVCWQNVGQDLNCGVCEKCLRTMIALEITGLRCPTFTCPLDLQKVARLKYKDRWLTRYGQLLNAAEQAGKQELAKAIRDMMQGKHHRGWRKLVWKLQRFLNRKTNRR